MTTLLFDLDGTLVDSSQGILAAFRYSFEQLGLAYPDREELMTFIGPPLQTTFATYFSSPDDIDKAIAAFRAYYDQKGVYETTVYTGVKESLAHLKQAGHHLFVTTSKNQPMATLMLSHLELNQYFTGIYGATASHHHKSDVIRSCLQDYQLHPEDCYIIGDTRYDMIGGRETGVHPIGVTWGFGSRQELLDNGAEAMMDKPDDLLSYFHAS
ncbi:HAD hydrolase-like protein [Streptococcus entericus]|uniref:HAD hydrolase-like protein n=1 Tax=Streptococcus entericus TaxID=155680 RepID=UPI0003652205|nr:HAD hydrolase-like protein [Streptococcus entericus]